MTALSAECFEISLFQRALESARCTVCGVAAWSLGALLELGVCSADGGHDLRVRRHRDGVTSGRSGACGVRTAGGDARWGDDHASGAAALALAHGDGE